MEYNFHWAGKQQMEMLMQPLPPTWGKYSPHTIATWASSLFRCKVRCSLLSACLFFPEIGLLKPILPMSTYASIWITQRHHRILPIAYQYKVLCILLTACHVGLVCPCHQLTLFTSKLCWSVFLPCTVYCLDLWTCHGLSAVALSSCCWWRCINASCCCIKPSGHCTGNGCMQLRSLPFAWDKPVHFGQQCRVSHRTALWFRKHGKHANNSKCAVVMITRSCDRFYERAVLLITDLSL